MMIYKCFFYLIYFVSIGDYGLNLVFKIRSMIYLL